MATDVKNNNDNNNGARHYASQWKNKPLGEKSYHKKNLWIFAFFNKFPQCLRSVAGKE